MFFKCKHPASMLFVYSEETVEPNDEDSVIVTYHLYCRKCNEKIDISYAKLIGGVDAYFARHGVKKL